MSAQTFSESYQSLRWAFLVSLFFLALGVLGLWLFAFAGSLPAVGMLLLAALTVICAVLFFRFLPAASATAQREKDRELAVCRVFRLRFAYVCAMLCALCLLLPLLLSVLFSGYMSAGTYFSLLPAIAGLFTLGVYAAAYALRRRLHTAAERTAAAAQSVPYSLNALSLWLAVVANLSLFIYRLMWMSTGYESDTVNTLCLVAFLLITVTALALPLASRTGRGRAVSRGMALLSMLRNFLVSIALLCINLSVVFSRLDDEHFTSVDPAFMAFGILLLALTLGGFHLLCRARTAKK